MVVAVESPKATDDAVVEHAMDNASGLFGTVTDDDSGTFRSEGLVVLRDVVTPRLFDLLAPPVEATVDAVERAQGEFREHRLDPQEGDLGKSITALVAAVMGIEPSSLRLAELLLSTYGSSTGSTPSLHKDRLASEVAVGVPLRLPAGSQFVYIEESKSPVRGCNPFESAGRYNRMLEARELIALRTAAPTAVDVGIGDVLMFPGSRWFHGRRSAAGSVVLYAKLNTLGLDPQGLDPRTRAERWRSLELVDGGDPRRMARVEVSMAAQLVGLSTFCSRDGSEVVTAELMERSVRLDPVDVELVRAVEGWTPAASLRGTAKDDDALRGRLRRLIRTGVLDARDAGGKP